MLQERLVLNNIGLMHVDAGQESLHKSTAKGMASLPNPLCLIQTHLDVGVCVCARLVANEHAVTLAVVARTCRDRQASTPWDTLVWRCLQHA
jgi:hypothetical protein